MGFEYFDQEKVMIAGKSYVLFLGINIHFPVLNFVRSVMRFTLARDGQTTRKTLP